MKFSLSLLQKLFDTPLDPHFLEDQLTRIGLEVDALEKISPSFQGVVIAKVIDVKAHPDAERLVIAQVDVGHETLQIVCGAPNCRKGLVTAAALIGAQLKDAQGKTHTIKKSSLRGVESSGMLVSKEELGLEEKSEGLIELEDSYSIGQPLEPFFEDTLLEISFTPNLGHAMSLLGVARELSCLLKKPFSFSPIQLSLPSGKTRPIQSSQECSHFEGWVITGLKVKPSPLWLQQKLKSLGYQSINNVVDATNYVLHEMGHPLHAYDLDKISLSTLTVKSFNASQTFEALDHKSYEVPPDTLFVCDESKLLSIAGIMGSANSCVDESTQAILLEAAVFDASSIRRASRKMGLSTEASKHFERKVDPLALKPALLRAASMILSLAGGKLEKESLFLESEKITLKQLKISRSFISQHLGVSISSKEIEEIFKHLEFQPKVVAQGEAFELTIPTYRNDIESEIDCVEEVARFYGFDRIELQSPKMISSIQSDSPLYLFEKKLHTLALQLGLQEILTCDLISPSQSKLQNPNGPILQALNSVSLDQSILRSSLLSNHLQVLKHNLNQNAKDLLLYEIGKTYTQKGDLFQEESVLSITLSGHLDPYHHEHPPEEVDFFHLKGLFESLFASLGCQKLEAKKDSSFLFHPFCYALWVHQKTPIGFLGELHPSLLRQLQIKQKVFFGEISVPSLHALSKPQQEIAPLCPFPSSERDWTITCLKELEVGHLLQFIHSLESRLLKDVMLLKIFESEKIGEGRKNVSLRFVYRNDKKTISFEATEVEHARILNLVLEKMKTLIVQPI